MENKSRWKDIAKKRFERETPKKYRSARLRDFSSVSEKDIIWNDCGFCLRGKTGIGKTHLATALARKYFYPTNPYSIAREVDGRIEYSENSYRWISVPSLLMEIRSTFNNRDGGTEKSIVDKFSKTKLLVMDDLGSEKISDWASSTLYVIISDRRNNMLQTIITTNQTIAEIYEWEPRIASRIGEMETISLPNIDRRINKAIKRPPDANAGP